MNHAPTLPSVGPWLRALTTAGRRLFFDRQLDFWLREVHPTWSLSETRAHVLAIVDETPNTRTFTLRPNAHWPGHEAGQFVPVTLAINGVRRTRCYSISSAPGQPTITLTVRRVTGGRVSTWLHDRVTPGDTVVLGDPAGDFTLPKHDRAHLLFVSGGSGVTPMLAMLDQLALDATVDDVVWVHYARTHDHIIARERVAAIASRWPTLHIHNVLDDDPTTPTGFESTHFRAMVPDFTTRSTWLCGPPGLMERAIALWRAEDAEHLLKTERFVPTRSRVRPRTDAPADVRITLQTSGRHVVGHDHLNLLEQLEAAGERPQHGCRMGICQSCRCRKISGAVENLLTGELSTEPDEDIQICVSAPRGDVTLDL